MQITKPIHVAFIVDGNGRWAKRQNKPRTFGHQAGVKRVQELLEYCKNRQDLSCLSFYIFSLENWKRDNGEIQFLFKYLNDFLDKETKNIIESTYKFHWSGFSDKLDQKLIDKLRLLQEKTKDHSGIIINFVFNYGGWQDIVHAANQLKNYPDEINKDVFMNALLTKGVPEVDLLIRTSGEQRISNFLIFLLSYAEFIFEPTYFPDYTPQIFEKNLLEFQHRDIRKGGYSKLDQPLKSNDVKPESK